MSKIDLVLQPLQGQDHVVFDHNQNKIAEDKEMGGVDHFIHRVCHLDLRIQPVRPNPLALRALSEEVLPSFNVEGTARALLCSPYASLTRIRFNANTL